MSFFGLPLYKRPSRRKKQRLVFPHRRLRRVSVELQLLESNETYFGRAVLHDLTQDGIGLFVDHFFSGDEKITVRICDRDTPLPPLRGRIAWCRPAPPTKLLKADNFPYRIGIEFELEMSEERHSLELFCAGLGVVRATTE